MGFLLKIHYPVPASKEVQLRKVKVVKLREQTSIDVSIVNRKKEIEASFV